MTEPYEVLGLAPDAEPAEIRSRYLELVRQHPPERDPARFAQVREAYDRLRDPIVSLENRLFCLTSSQTFERLLYARRPDVRARRLPTKVLLSLAQS